MSVCMYLHYLKSPLAVVEQRNHLLVGDTHSSSLQLPEKTLHSEASVLVVPSYQAHPGPVEPQQQLGDGLHLQFRGKSSVQAAIIQDSIFRIQEVYSSHTHRGYAVKRCIIQITRIGGIRIGIFTIFTVKKTRRNYNYRIILHFSFIFGIKSGLFTSHIHTFLDTCA